MPASARKSSVGTARRALQKAHIPYRGDNPEVGKKTGIAVQHVERKSDGFEPFEEVMQQADGRTPPRPKGRKKSSIRHYDDEDEEDEDDYSDNDGYGEMSMQLDSPVANLTNHRPPTTPTNGRQGSSSRPVARSSNVDFDKIPSPRPRKAANAKHGSSQLSRSYIPKDREPSFDSQDGMEVDGDSGGQEDGGFDDFEGPAGGESSPRRTSFTQMDQEDDDDDDENEPFNDLPEEPYDEPDEEPQEPERGGSETPKPKKADKGKGRAVQPESEDDQVEDDIARGLSDVNGAQFSDDDDPGPEPEPAEPTPEPEPAPAPAPKKKKVKISEQSKPIRTKTQSNKENRDYPPGVRRSRREHIAPLEFWRGERVVYGRPDFSQVDPAKVLPIPQIREIIRIPKEPPQPLGKRKRGHPHRGRSKTAEPGAPHSRSSAPPAPANPEEGWDDDTPSNAKVLDYRTGQEVERRIAWTAKMVNPQPVANNTWSFDKIFGDADFIASGQLVIPPGSRKPSKATKDNTYIFYVIEGAVNLKVHETSLVLSTGGMFMVPRGNTYFIENISQRDAKLFFTQARKTMNDEDERVIALANRARKRQRSSSAGAITGRRTSAAPSNDATPRR